jgi:toxin ParE1/3/4
MRAYILSTKAAADLVEIAEYTKRQWGGTQARTYRSQLKKCIAALVAGKDQFKDLSALRPGLRMTRCQHHYIVAVMRGNAPAIVVGVFHERMDLMARLAERLK